MKKTLLFLAFWSIGLSFSFAQTIYVNAASTGANNGSSWDDAFTSLHEALSMTNSKGEFWVAQGTYYPTGDNSRSASFELSQTKLYGGFNGTETLLEQRDPSEYKTILSGDIGVLDDESDNSFHIIIVNGSTILDGFTIADANNDSAGDPGAGLYFEISPTPFLLTLPTFSLTNCSFENNQAPNGAAMYISFDETAITSGAASSYTISQCSFFNNKAKSNGGAIFLDDLNANFVSIVLEDVNFEGNEAKNGGAILTEKTDLSINRGVFKNNDASSLGTEIYTNDSELNLDNVAIYNPQVLTGFDESLEIKQTGLIYLSQSSLSANYTTVVGHTEETDGLIYYELGKDNNALTIRNSIFWNLNVNGLLYANTKDAPVINGSISQSLVSPFADCEVAEEELVPACAGVSFEGIVYDAPQFLDIETGDLRLNIFSPAIDKGEMDNIGSKDVLGKARAYSEVGEAISDLGAYEFDGTAIAIDIPNQPNAQCEADLSYLAADGWTHYINSPDQKLLLSVKKAGQNVGTLNENNFGIRVVTSPNYGTQLGAKDLSDAKYLATPNNGWFVMNRFWEVKNAESLNTPLLVRFYYDDQDLSDLRKSIEDQTGESKEDLPDQELFFYLINNQGQDPHSKTPTASQFEQRTFADEAGMNTWTTGNYNNINYAEFLVNDLSSGSAGTSAAGQAPSLLPVELLKFTATRINDDILLEWATATEINNDYFLIERSSDGAQFFPLDFVDGAGNSSSTIEYEYMDFQAHRGFNYYRLKQIDFDGSFEYSQVVTINLSNAEAKIFLFPNPTATDVQVQLPEVFKEQAATLTIYNLMGQKLFDFPIASANNNELMEFDVSRYHPGTYLMVVQNEFFYFSGRFVVLK